VIVSIFGLLRFAVAAKIVLTNVASITWRISVVTRQYPRLPVSLGKFRRQRAVLAVLAPRHDHGINGGSVSNFVKRKKVFIGYSKLVFQ
jgi:hypothetical protein